MKYELLNEILREDLDFLLRPENLVPLIERVEGGDREAEVLLESIVRRLQALASKAFKKFKKASLTFDKKTKKAIKRAVVILTLTGVITIQSITPAFAATFAETNPITGKQAVVQVDIQNKVQVEVAEMLLHEMGEAAAYAQFIADWNLWVLGMMGQITDSDPNDPFKPAMSDEEIAENKKGQRTFNRYAMDLMRTAGQLSAESGVSMDNFVDGMKERAAKMNNAWDPVRDVAIGKVQRLDNMSNRFLDIMFDAGTVFNDTVKDIEKDNKVK